MTELGVIAAQLVQAWRTGQRISSLVATPSSVEEGHAVQAGVARLLGEEIGGFKANAPPGEPPVRGAIYQRLIFTSPAGIPATSVPDLGVEGEIAFRFLQDMPQRATEYSREEVANAVTALPAVEIVSSRLQDWQQRPILEQLADNLNNGALVTGPETAAWRSLDIGALPVRAFVNDEKVQEQIGGHSLGDPLAVAIALANMLRTETGVRAGQLVTTGSCVGIRFLRPGDRFAVEFAGLGRAEVNFLPE